MKHIPRLKAAAPVPVLEKGFSGAGLALFWRGKPGPFAVPIPVGGLDARDVPRAQVGAGGEYSPSMARPAVLEGALVLARL